MKIHRGALIGLAALSAAGCLRVKMDVNAKVEMDVRLKADRVIEEYLSELNRRRAELQQAEISGGVK